MTFQGKLPPYGMPPAGGITERPELKEFDFFAPPGGPGGPGPGGPGPGPGGPGGPGFDGPPPQPKSDDNERAFEILGGKCVQKDARVSVMGTIGDSEAVGVTFSTDAPSLCGIFVNGDSKYAVRDSEFRAVGDGKNDFAGDGAVLLVDHDGELEVRDTKITTVGCIRPCTTAMGDSTLRVYNCVLTGEGGTLPEDYVPVIGPGMKTPPEGLEIGGNCRTHLSVGNSKAYFYDSTIIADGWAALSTDGCTDSLYLEANNCDVICRNSGYGVYSDGGCNVVLNGCRMNTATHGAIMAGECTLKSRDTQWKSGEYGFMIHCVMGMPEEIGDVSIYGGSIETASDSFFVKSQNAYIDLQGVSIQSGGAIVHSIVNPDVCATKVPAGQAVYGIKVSMTDMDVSGDLIHEDPDRTMSLSLKGTKLSGKLENVYLSLDSASAFTAAADSTVCLVGPCAGKLDAPAGVTIFATTGEGCDLTQSTVLPSGGKLQF